VIQISLSVNIQRSFWVDMCICTGWVCRHSLMFCSCNIPEIKLWWMNILIRSWVNCLQGDIVSECNLCWWNLWECFSGDDGRYWLDGMVASDCIVKVLIQRFIRAFIQAAKHWWTELLSIWMWVGELFVHKPLTGVLLDRYYECKKYGEMVEVGTG